MSYREKQCPTCGEKHKKRGPYCSRSCGNKRTWTDEQKKVFAEKKRKHMYETDKGEVERWQVNAKEEDEPLAPVKREELGYGKFVEDGDIWEEV